VRGGRGGEEERGKMGRGGEWAGEGEGGRGEEEVGKMGRGGEREGGGGGEGKRGGVGGGGERAGEEERRSPESRGPSVSGSSAN